MAAAVELAGGIAAEWLASLAAAVEQKQHCSPCKDCTQHLAAADGVERLAAVVGGVAVLTAEWPAGSSGRRQYTACAAGRPNN